MKSVVFLYNYIMNEQKQKLAKLPLEFICFAYIKDAVLYVKKDICYAVRKEDIKRTKYNKVYGALYVLHDSEFTLRTLDAVNTCSYSFVGYNHKNDIMHRYKTKARPIHFKNIEQFFKMKYNEGEDIQVSTYFANPQNAFVRTNVLNAVKNRCVEGFDINNYINLLLVEKKE